MADTNGEFPTVIGPDACFKGELSFEKGVRLLGQFEGEIRTKGNLLVSEGAKISGDVIAGTVRLDGAMAGNLSASGKVQLSATARLEGDLKTARLEVADGATFIGRVAVGPQVSKAGAAPNAQAAAQAGTAKGKVEQQAQPAGKRS